MIRRHPVSTRPGPLFPYTMLFRSMVTGSHNPPSYIVFKLVLEKAPFFGSDIQALGTLAASADYASGRGSVGSLSVFDAYVESLLASVAGRQSLKVAWDAGNGATGEVLAAVVTRLPGVHVLLNEIGRAPV